MTAGLFDDPSMYAAATDQQRGTMRALALGGVLQTLRTARGWSVEQAAVHAGLGHMTWRRMEDGFNVRAKTYAAVDTLFELPFGTVKRALNDDLLMVQLIGRVGVDTSEVSTSSAPRFVDTFARQTLSKTAREAVRARAMPGRASSRGAVPDRPEPLPPPLPGNVAALSDIETAAQLLDRLTRRRMTPAMDTAVRALLDVMPELIARDAPAGDEAAER